MFLFWTMSAFVPPVLFMMMYSFYFTAGRQAREMRTLKEHTLDIPREKISLSCLLLLLLGTWDGLF
jgi:hypothetical protein